MNILQAHKYYWRRDGASNYMIDLSKQLKQKGHEVIPFTMQQEETLKSEFSDYFIEYHDLSDPSQYTLSKQIEIAAKFIYNWQAKDNLKLLLQELEGQLDIAHLHNIYHHISPSIISPLYRRNIPTVMTLHDYKLICPNYTMFHQGEICEQDCKGWYLNCIKDKCMKDSLLQSILVTTEMIVHHKLWGVYNNIDKFIAPSKFIRDKCIEYGWSEEKFVHIPNPINLDQFEFSKQEGDYVAYVGRLAEEKGVDTLLGAAKQLPEIPFFITGSGGYEKHLKQRCKQEGIDNITFDGFLSGESLEARIRNADILVLPSVWYENYPISILEAKAMGRLVLGSDIGGIPEQLPDELLFEPKDSQGLAEKIDYWFNADENEKSKLRQRLYRQVEQDNNTQDHLAEITELYHSLT